MPTWGESLSPSPAAAPYAGHLHNRAFQTLPPPRQPHVLVQERLTAARAGEKGYVCSCTLGEFIGYARRRTEPQSTQMKAARLKVCDKPSSPPTTSLGSVSPACSSPCEVPTGDMQLPCECKYRSKNVKKNKNHCFLLPFYSEARRELSFTLLLTHLKNFFLKWKKAKASTAFLALL